MLVGVKNQRCLGCRIDVWSLLELASYYESEILAHHTAKRSDWGRPHVWRLVNLFKSQFQVGTLGCRLVAGTKSSTHPISIDY